ncbi:MAG: hypothetical protein ABGX16_03640 [Pirellulales bacterium]
MGKVSGCELLESSAEVDATLNVEGRAVCGGVDVVAGSIKFPVETRRTIASAAQHIDYKNRNSENAPASSTCAIWGLLDYRENERFYDKEPSIFDQGFLSK